MGVPRSLAEDLRHRDDEQLLRLFASRPQLLRPVPKSFADLAVRANSTAATVAALDALDRAELDVLTAACARSVDGVFAPADLAQGLGVDVDDVAAIVVRLLDQVLLWGSVTDLRVPSGVREVLGADAGGLDPTPRPDSPGVRAALADADALRAALAAAPDNVRTTIQTWCWDCRAVPADDDTLAWLAERGLLARDEAGCHLPREVALLLRGGMLLSDTSLTPPRPPQQPDKWPGTDDRAGHAADALVRDTERMVADVFARPWHRSSGGGISARDWDRAATVLRLDAQRLALLLALAWAAGLVDADDDRLRATTAYAHWSEQPVAQRWAVLAAAWIGLPVLVPGDSARVLAAREDAGVTATRELLLHGLVAGAGFDVPAWLRWYRPRLRPDPGVLHALLAEAEAVGLTAGALPAAPCRELRWPVAVAQLADSITPVLPALTDRVILQADLTATALGPLEPTIERRLGQLASWESGGAAAVYRFSPDTLRRALARGEDPDELVRWLGQVSATPVPQALLVLIEDLSRALPTITVQPVHALLRCDDETALRLSGDDRLADLGLVAVAPGLVTARVPLAEVTARLRETGYPVHTTEDRTPLPAPARTPLPTAPGPGAARIVRLLRTIERREHPEEHPPPDLIAGGPQMLHAQLTSAAQAHGRLWLGFADDTGTRLTHLVEPLALEDGDAYVFDASAGEVRVVPLERIIGFAPVTTQ